MARYSNLIEQAVQLADDGGDLLGQVAGVHDCRACLRLRRGSIAHAQWIDGGCGELQPRNVDKSVGLAGSSKERKDV